MAAERLGPGAMAGSGAAGSGQGQNPAVSQPVIMDFGSVDPALENNISALRANPGQDPGNFFQSVHTIIPQLYEAIKGWAAVVISAMQRESTRVDQIHAGMATADQTITTLRQELDKTFGEVKSSLLMVDDRFKVVDQDIQTVVQGMKTLETGMGQGGQTIIGQMTSMDGRTAALEQAAVGQAGEMATLKQIISTMQNEIIHIFPLSLDRSEK